MHLKTDDGILNQELKIKLGRLFGRHTATLTKEEASQALHVIEDQFPRTEGCLSLLKQACVQKRTLGH